MKHRNTPLRRHSHVWYDQSPLWSRSQLWHDSSTFQRAFSRMIWLRHLWEGVRMCDMTQSRDVLMLEMTQSPVRRCSLAWHDSVTCQKAFACVACLSHCVHLEGVLACDMTQGHDSLKEKCWGGVGGSPRSRAATTPQQPPHFFGEYTTHTLWVPHVTHSWNALDERLSLSLYSLD